MEPTFKRVWIKTESDLPKEEGVYFYHNKDDKFRGVMYFDNSKEFTSWNWWLHHIDWYLIEQPIEQPETLTKERLRDAFDAGIEYDRMIHGNCIDGCDFETWFNKHSAPDINVTSKESE